MYEKQEWSDVYGETPFNADRMKHIEDGIYENSLDNVYSTEEVFTGKYWIDGKKIYKKTISFNASSTEIYINTGIPNSSIDNMWIARPSYCIESNGAYFYNLDGSFYKSNGDWLSARINCDYGDIARVELKSDSVSRIEKGYVTIEYTKTTE